MNDHTRTLMKHWSGCAVYLFLFRFVDGWMDTGCEKREENDANIFFSAQQKGRVIMSCAMEACDRSQVRIHEIRSFLLASLNLRCLLNTQMEKLSRPGICVSGVWRRNLN